MENEQEQTVTAKDIMGMTKARLVEFIDEFELEVDYDTIKTVPALKAAVLEALELEVEVEVEKAPAPAGHVFTYVGKGADSPRIIVLMGKQKFIRGHATVVTDPELLAKLPGIATFVEGEADEETLHAIDEEGKTGEVAQKEKDRILNAAVTKRLRGE